MNSDNFSIKLGKQIAPSMTCNRSTRGCITKEIFTRASRSVQRSRINSDRFLPPQKRVMSDCSMIIHIACDAIGGSFGVSPPTLTMSAL